MEKAQLPPLGADSQRNPRCWGFDHGAEMIYLCNDDSSSTYLPHCLYSNVDEVAASTPRNGPGQRRHVIDTAHRGDVSISY